MLLLFRPFIVLSSNSLIFNGCCHPCFCRSSDVGKQVLYRDFYMSGWALKEYTIYLKLIKIPRMDVQINIVVKQPHVMTNIVSLKINKNLEIVYKLKEITQEDVACIPLISGRGKAVRNEYFTLLFYI